MLLNFILDMQGVVHAVSETISLVAGNDSSYSTPIAAFIMGTCCLSTSSFISLLTMHKITGHISGRKKKHVVGNVIEGPMVVSINFCILLVTISLLMRHNVSWLVLHIFGSRIRIYILLYWLSVLGVGLPIMRYVAQSGHLPNIVGTFIAEDVVGMRCVALKAGW